MSSANHASDATGTGPSLGAFDWADPFLLDEQLNDEERMIRDAARTFAQARLQPAVSEAYLQEKSDPAIFAELGVEGVTCPPAYAAA